MYENYVFYTLSCCVIYALFDFTGLNGGLSYNLSWISLFSCQIWYDYVLMECRLVNLKLNSVNINSDVVCFDIWSFVSCLIITGLLVWVCVGGKNDIEIFNVSKLFLWVLVRMCIHESGTSNCKFPFFSYYLSWIGHEELCVNCM